MLKGVMEVAAEIASHPPIGCVWLQARDYLCARPFHRRRAGLDFHVERLHADAG